MAFDSEKAVKVFAVVNFGLIVLTYVFAFTIMCMFLAERTKDKHFWKLMEPDLGAIRPIE